MSLIEDVEERVCNALRICSTRHISAMRDLRLPPDQDLVDLIFRTVACYYERGDATANRRGMSCMRCAIRGGWKYAMPPSKMQRSPVK
jgi:hypothetical protein